MNNINILDDRLKEYFYNKFKIADYHTTLMNLYNVNERERIIQELSKSKEDARYFNSTYEKTLKEVSNIFKNNDIYLQEQKKKEEQNLLIEKQRQKEEERRIVLEKMKEERLKKEKEKKQEQKWELIAALTSIILTLALPAFLIGLLIWGYFKFAVPILG